MHVRQLEAFYATMTAGTITRAAEILCVSQPSVSRLIADLEQDIGFPLFERRNRRVFPTPEGSKMFKEVQRVYDGINDLKNLADSIQKEKSGYIVISATPVLSFTLLPKVIKQFLKENHKANITLNARGPDRVSFDLLKGKAHIGFSILRPNETEIIQEKLISADHVCALPPGHRLTDKQVIVPEDLESEKIIALDNAQDFFWEQHEKMYKNYNLELYQRISTQRSFAAYSMVLEGVGIAILEPFSAGFWSKMGVVIKPFLPRISYDFAIYFPADDIRSEQVRRLSYLAKKFLNDTPLPFQNYKVP